MASDYYSAPSHATAVLNELGIDMNNVEQAFDPTRQPKEIGNQFTKAKANKYEEEVNQNKEDDNEIPMTLQEMSVIQKKPVKAKDAPQKGRKKDSKRGLKKGKGKKESEEENKKETDMNVELDQVAEWGQKGTKANNEDDEEDFDGDEPEEKEENTAEQQAIRKRLEEKLKKYENPGSSGASGQPKSSADTLKSKADSLKKKNQSESIGKVVDQSTQELLQPRQPVKQQKVVQQQEQQQEQSEDPWQKINQKTLQEKQVQNEALKNAEQTDLNKYYQNLKLEDEDDPSENDQPSTGFFQTLCGCLKPKKKSLTQLQKQIIKISKIQLSNKPEEVTLLKSIWTGLTNKKYLRYGEHWSEIGFQGRDPATDLRSTGVLSLLHWDNFIKFDIQYCTKLLNFCVEFDMPLALTHIKVTSLLCSSLKRRQLQGKTWVDFLEWYYALCYYTFDYIIQQAKSSSQVGQLVQKSIERTKGELQNAKKHFNKEIKSKR